MPNHVQQYNDRGIDLMSAGRYPEAVAAFSEAIAHAPSAVEPYYNLANALEAMGSLDAARQAYDAALLRAPRMLAARTGRARLLLRLGKTAEARDDFDAALELDPTSTAAHLGLYELFQIVGEPERALEHQRRALERQRLFSHVAPHAARSILVLCTPGDWQANVPVDFIFDPLTTSVHKLYLIDGSTSGLALPPYDVVFNAIAESETSAEPLRWAAEFADGQPRPLLNRAQAVVQTGRLALAATLRGTGARVAPTRRVTRGALAAAAATLGYPLIVRPVGSHAGHGLERVASGDALHRYLSEVSAAELFVSEFVDYAGDDGYFRKYRIVYVDGEPYPVHMAISQNWMIHYYNAPMAENAWMRAEEAEFLADWRSHFAGPLERAVRAVGAALALEYVGIDAAVDREGRLLVFEADPAMLVHTSDPIDLYPYKHEFVPRIFRALERMVDRRKGADT